MTAQETFQDAFTEPPGTNLAGIPVRGLVLPSPYVSWGIPYYESCVKHVRDTFHASKVYIMASASLSKNTDRLEKLKSALQESGAEVVGIGTGIRPHSPWSQTLQMAAECRAGRADCVVTLGAGSTTDAAKVLVLCLANDITGPTDLARYSVEAPEIATDVKQPTIPLITIPTSLSGGEYFSLAGGTDDFVTHHKQAFIHSGMGSKLVILDPELSVYTPEYYWLSTGVRSIDHCVEALVSLEATKVSDDYAERGLRLLVPNLIKSKTDPNNIEARLQCQLAVRLAMANVRGGIPLGGSHAIGHQLGPLGVPHGITSCILCPAVMKYNIKYGSSNPDIASKQKKVCDIFWSEPIVAQTLRAKGLSRNWADLGDCLDAIFRTLDLPRSLHEAGIKPDIIPQLSKRALDDFWALTNPIPLNKAEQVQEILEAVVGS